MRILIITRSAWDNSNSMGNTMTNLFTDFDGFEIANLYYRKALPKNNVCKHYFSISDIDLIKNLLNKKHKVGYEFNNIFSNNTNEINKEEKIYSKYRNSGSTILLNFQNLIWDIGRWKNENLLKFLNDFNPDIIFSPSYHPLFTYKILKWLTEFTNARLVLYHSDDHLKKRTLSLNPLKILLGHQQKKWLKKCIEISSLNYCIQDNQIEEYQNVFPHKTFKLLQKGSVYNEIKFESKEKKNPFNIVYTGALGTGRIDTLIYIVKKVNESVELKGKIKFSIYSQYKITKKQYKRIEIQDVCKFYGKVESDELKEIYSNADFLLLIESFQKKNIEQTRYSFSTKIIDYLTSNRPIIAVGPQEIGSMRYLEKNKIALVINELKDAISEISNFIFNDNVQNIYLKNSRYCLLNYHNIEMIRDDLRRDFTNLI